MCREIGGREMRRGVRGRGEEREHGLVDVDAERPGGQDIGSDVEF